MIVCDLAVMGFGVSPDDSVGSCWDGVRGFPEIVCNLAGIGVDSTFFSV